MNLPLPDDAFIAATRRLLKAESPRDLEYVLSPDAFDFNPYYIRALNYHLEMVPWIEAVFPLSDASVLEVGFGGGEASFAVGHRCGKLDAFDIDRTSLDLVSLRTKEYGPKNICFEILDPEWAKSSNISKFSETHTSGYDVVLLPAVLEHMTIEERLEVLQALWTLLRVDGIMVVYDTPNRLYPLDFHSFRLPFFDWLPEEIAVRYASHSPRHELPQMLASASDRKLMLHRIGRGASYHEFDLAIGLNAFDVVNDGYSSLLSHRKRNTVYEGFLAGALNEFAPHVAPGFGKAFLELVLRKKWNATRMVRKSDTTDDVSPVRKAYTRMEGPSASIIIEINAGRPQKALRVDVLKHAWSGTLVFSDLDGNEFHSENLYLDYQQEARVEATLPPKCDIVRLGLRPSLESNGMQAWIFGIGSA